MRISFYNKNEFITQTYGVDTEMYFIKSNSQSKEKLLNYFENQLYNKDYNKFYHMKYGTSLNNHRKNLLKLYKKLKQPNEIKLVVLLD